MNNRELKKVLIESLQREQEYYDFCIECLKKLYPEREARAISMFEESIDFYEYNGCLQSLCCLDSNLKREEKQAQEMKEIRDIEAKTKEVGNES